MPNKMLKQCRVPRCPGLTREKYCDKHAHLEAKLKAEANKHYDKVFRDQDAKAFYHSPQWKKVRAIKMNRNPFCEICSANNRYARAEIVDHIVEIRDGGAALNIDNLQSLCRTCHNQKTAKERIKRNN